MLLFGNSELKQKAVYSSMVCMAFFTTQQNRCLRVTLRRFCN